MTQTTFDGNLTPSEALLDQNFTQLYNLRELISTTGYTAATPKFDATNGDWKLVAGGGLGYGVGSGGSVTQITSKGTTVTLNKPSGLITTHNASLAAGASATFSLSNTTIATSDTCVCHVSGAAGGAQNYTVRPFAGGAGTIAFVLTNVTGSTLAENVNITFAVIKGAAT